MGRSSDGRPSEERLAAYDAFADEVRAELARASSRMEELRGSGGARTATYRQLFAIRATLREIDRRLVDHGL